MNIRSTGKKGAATITAVAAVGAVVITTATAAALWPSVSQAGTSGSSNNTGDTESNGLPGGSYGEDDSVPAPVTPAQPQPAVPHARTQGS